MPKQTLQTTAAVIDALGGLDAIATLTSRGYTAAHNWKQFNKFPPVTYLLMTKALERVGYSADPALWQMEPDDQH